MYLNKLSKLKVMFILPKRGKGSCEIIGNITILSRDDIEPENFIRFFIKYQKHVLNRDTLNSIGMEIVEQLKLKNLEIIINFELPIDRLSPAWEESLCIHLESAYYFTYSETTQAVAMSIECPVRVQSVSTLEGSLFLKLEEPLPNTYFENMLDIVLNYGNVIIYPVTSVKDKSLLRKAIDNGKTAEDYLHTIKNEVLKKQLAKKVELRIIVPDIYNNYQLEKVCIW